ncbi:granzyme M-like isoform X2 [Brachyhypopomus gauderio]|uniref:granzyme M-like isoform X2 n=1 Tax=Brachyhypopomus gauderio TaxID=698409 RepID=UPI0040424C21
MGLIHLLLLGALLPHLSHSARVSVGIVNGTEAKPHSRPYMVSVQKHGRHICGGFLVSDMFVMTAAHCWKYGDNMTVVMGAHDLSDNRTSTNMAVKYYHIYPEFALEGLNDIMLLQLNGGVKKSPVINWIPIREKKKPIKANTICSVAGWGKTSTNGNISVRLMEAEVTVVGRKSCAKSWGSTFYAPTMVCTAGRGGFCKGDSGGPLVCNNTAVDLVPCLALVTCQPSVYPA